ncbi:MAG: hypothetical protein ACOYO0_04790 [Sandarakinorhabdus sp.]
MSDEQPNQSGDEKPKDFNQKVDDLAEGAMEAGKKFVATDTGRKVADATDTAFAKAEALARQAAESEYGRKALDSDVGRQATDLVKQADSWTKSNIPNTLARNVAIGAAAGVVVSLPVPIIGWFTGALIGGALGFLRTVNKKS